MEISLKNLGTVNKNYVSISKNSVGSIDIYFSYETPVSFDLRTPTENRTATRKNDWSTTTGKLLNECEPDKSKRISGEEFKKELENALKVFN